MENRALSEKMEEILGLETPPIAVKIIKPEECIPNIDSPERKSRYCQLLMLARKGRLLKLTPKNIACPAAKADLGWK